MHKKFLTFFISIGLGILAQTGYGSPNEDDGTPLPSPRLTPGKESPHLPSAPRELASSSGTKQGISAEDLQKVHLRSGQYSAKGDTFFVPSPEQLLEVAPSHVRRFLYTLESRIDPAARAILPAEVIVNIPPYIINEMHFVNEDPLDLQASKLQRLGYSILNSDIPTISKACKEECAAKCFALAAEKYMGVSTFLRHHSASIHVDQLFMLDLQTSIGQLYWWAAKHTTNAQAQEGYYIHSLQSFTEAEQYAVNVSNHPIKLKLWEFALNHASPQEVEMIEKTLQGLMNLLLYKIKQYNLVSKLKEDKERASTALFCQFILPRVFDSHQTPSHSNTSFTAFP
jgi:hypothetical protein